MARIVATEFISLDGVVEDPGGSEDFKHGGWSFEISSGDDGAQFKVDETMASEAMLLGRRTYEGFAEAWPEREGEFAERFNTMPKYVVSSTLPTRSGTTRPSSGSTRSPLSVRGRADRSRSPAVP